MARNLLAGADRTVTHLTAATKQHRNRPMQPEAALRSRGSRRQASKRPDATTTAKQLPPAQVQALIPITSVEPKLAERLPRPNASQRRTRRRADVAKALTDRPAIARSDSSSCRIVVISPEEARRAREHAAQATPKPRFTRVIPSSGRLAFEDCLAMRPICSAARRPMATGDPPRDVRSRYSSRDADIRVLISHRRVIWRLCDI
jgi:hypothetical protein